jgi:DNA-binding PadR family transcriptional regulator
VAAPPLTETSYIVLGLLDLNEPATPYDLKQFVKVSISNFWSAPHTQIYSECARLTKAGMLIESREEEGRRRRFYRLSKSGRRALEKWRTEPTDKLIGGNYLAGLKLFLGADPVPLAQAQVAAHKQMLKEMETVVAYPALSDGVRLTTELGIQLERTLIRFWSRVASQED